MGYWKESSRNWLRYLLPESSWEKLSVWLHLHFLTSATCSICPSRTDTFIWKNFINTLALKCELPCNFLRISNLASCLTFCSCFQILHCLPNFRLLSCSVPEDCWLLQLSFSCLPQLWLITMFGFLTIWFLTITSGLWTCLCPFEHPSTTCHTIKTNFLLWVSSHNSLQPAVPGWGITASHQISARITVTAFSGMLYISQSMTAISITYVYENPTLYKKLLIPILSLKKTETHKAE